MTKDSLKNVAVLALLILVFEGVSGAIGRYTMGGIQGWYQEIEKSALTPPDWTFGVVWPILYAMMGFALALVCAAWGAGGRTAAIALFAVQFAVNLAWSPTFFGAHQIAAGLAVIVLLDVLVVATIALFWRVRRLAGVLLLPYLAWILFATLLNYEFLRLNPQADGAPEQSGAVQRIEI